MDVFLHPSNMDEPIGLLQVLDFPLAHLCFRYCAVVKVLVPVKWDKTEG